MNKRLIATLIYLSNITHALDRPIEEEHVNAMQHSEHLQTERQPLEDIAERHKQHLHEVKTETTHREPTKLLEDIHVHITSLQDNAHQWHESIQEAKTFLDAQGHLEDENLIDSQTGKLTLADPYKTLGISTDATEAEIKRAYRKASLKFHPDKLAGEPEEVRANGEAKFKEISQAYTVLTTPELKASYDLFKSAKKMVSQRFKGSFAEFRVVVPAALEHATNMITAIDEHLAKLKDGTVKRHEVDALNETLKSEYQKLKSILNETESNVQLDGEQLQSQMKSWAKTMLAHIQDIHDQIEPPKPTAEEALEEDLSSTQARTDEAYTKWLYENPTSITFPSHGENTPLEEALRTNSPEMARNIIAAARYHGITMEQLLEPIKEEYKQLNIFNHEKQAEALKKKIYKIGDFNLTSEFNKEVQRLRNY